MAAALIFLLLLSATTQAAESPGIAEAMRLVSSGKVDQAAAMLLELERAHPRDAELEYRLGLVFLKLGKLAEARVRLEEAARLDPQYPFIRAALGLLHDGLAKAALQGNDAPAAAREFQEAIRLDPDRAVYYLDLGRLLLDHDTADAAEIVLKNASVRLPKHSGLLQLLGLACFAQGKSREALDAYLKAIDADPDSEEAYASLEVLLPDVSPRISEVGSRLRAFSDRRPSSPLGPYLLARLYPDQSEVLLHKAIAAAPGFWPAYFELYKLFKARGAGEEAANALLQTVRLNPGYAPAHYALAEYYSRHGDRVRAAQERETHHQLLARQRRSDEEHRARYPRLAYSVSNP